MLKAGRQPECPAKKLQGCRDIRDIHNGVSEFHAPAPSRNPLPPYDFENIHSRTICENENGLFPCIARVAWRGFSKTTVCKRSADARRSILSAAERDNLLALPEGKDELIRRYTLAESDLSIISRHRGAANRLGFAVQLCYLRFPGIVLGVDDAPFPPLPRMVAAQLRVAGKAGMPMVSASRPGGNIWPNYKHCLDLSFLPSVITATRCKH